jgi:hypothetical protein
MNDVNAGHRNITVTLEEYTLIIAIFTYDTADAKVTGQICLRWLRCVVMSVVIPHLTYLRHCIRNQIDPCTCHSSNNTAA